MEDVTVPRGLTPGWSQEKGSTSMENAFLLAFAPQGGIAWHSAGRLIGANPLVVAIYALGASK